MPKVKSISNNGVNPPPPDPSRCHAYLQKVAAAVIFVIAGIFLRIPIYICLGLAMPWHLCHQQLMWDNGAQLDDPDDFWEFKNIETWTCTDYMAAFGWALFIIPAIPSLILQTTALDQKIGFVADTLPRTLWDKANAELALCQ